MLKKMIFFIFGFTIKKMQKQVNYNKWSQVEVIYKNNLLACLIFFFYFFFPSQLSSNFLGTKHSLSLLGCGSQYISCSKKSLTLTIFLQFVLTAIKENNNIPFWSIFKHFHSLLLFPTQSSAVSNAYFMISSSHQYSGILISSIFNLNSSIARVSTFVTAWKVTDLLNLHGIKQNKKNEKKKLYFCWSIMSFSEEMFSPISNYVEKPE